MPSTEEIIIAWMLKQRTLCNVWLKQSTPPPQKKQISWLTLAPSWGKNEKLRVFRNVGI